MADGKMSAEIAFTAKRYDVLATTYELLPESNCWQHTIATNADLRFWCVCHLPLFSVMLKGRRLWYVLRSMILRRRCYCGWYSQMKGCVLRQVSTIFRPQRQLYLLICTAYSGLATGWLYSGGWHSKRAGEQYDSKPSHVALHDSNALIAISWKCLQISHSWWADVWLGCKAQNQECSPACNYADHLSSSAQ